MHELLKTYRFFKIIFITINYAKIQIYPHFLQNSVFSTPDNMEYYVLYDMLCYVFKLNNLNINNKTF